MAADPVEAPIPRPTARVLVLDERDRLLLLLADGEFRGSGLPVWLPPGGGLEAGETHEQAAKRELREEVGLDDSTIGPCVWLRSLPFRMDGRRYAKQERFYVCRVQHFKVNESLWLQLDTESVLEYRWWSAEEIAASSDVFVPRALGRLLKGLLSGDFPAEPFAVDI